MTHDNITLSDAADKVSFFGTRRQPVAALAGFRKHHRIPTGDDSTRLRYLAEIANSDVDQDLDELFQQIRSAFGLKRKELQVSGPIDASGSIHTPLFDYRIDLLLDADEKSVLWRRWVGDFQGLECVFRPEFDRLFGERLDTMQIDLTVPLDVEAIIDHVESLPDTGCALDYDRDATWCQIKLADSPVVMRIAGAQISIQGSSELTPAEVAVCYNDLQRRFLEAVDLLE